MKIIEKATKITEKISKFNLEVIITVFSILIAIIEGLKIILNLQYKFKAGEFYNIPSYLFELNIFEFIYTPILMILLLGIFCIGLKKLKKESETDRVALLIFSIIASLLNLLILASPIVIILSYLKFISILKFYGKYFSGIFTILWILFFYGYYKKIVWMRYIESIIFTIFLYFFISNFLNKISFDLASKKNYEIFQDENKVIISQYQGNYVCMNYENIKDGIIIDATSYMLVPISGKKIEYKSFKDVKIYMN